MKELESFTKEQLDYICKYYDLMPKKIYERKENGVVYIMYKGEEPLYVGQTNDIRTRMYNHFNNPESWKSEVNRIVYFETDMLSQEVYYIHTLNPKYNKDRFETYKTPDKQPIYNKKEVNVVKGKIEGEDFEKSVKIEEVLDLIESLLKEGKDVDLKETIREGLYHPNTSKNTIASWYKRDNREKIIALAKKYKAEFYTKKGKYGGAFIRF